MVINVKIPAIIIFIIFCSGLALGVGLKSVSSDLSQAVSSGSSVSATKLQTPTQISLPSSTIDAPAGSTVSVASGSPSFSQVSRVKMDSGSTLNKASDVKMGRDGSIKAASATSYITPYLKIEGASDLAVSPDDSEISFSYARKLEAAGMVLGGIRNTEIQSKPEGPVQSIDLTVRRNGILLTQNPLVPNDKTQLLGFYAGNQNAKMQIDTSKWDQSNSGSKVDFTFSGTSVKVGQYGTIIPYTPSRCMIVSPTVTPDDTYQITIKNAVSTFYRPSFRNNDVVTAPNQADLTFGKIKRT